MRCANPACRVIAEDLLKGTLRLLEFETAPDDRILYAAGGFPVCTAQTKYFWLCQACSRLFTIKTWNSSGVILEPFTGNHSMPAPGAERKPASRADPGVAGGHERLYEIA